MNRINTTSQEVQLPTRFRCGASYQWRNGGGYLTVAQGALTFEFDRLMQAFGAPAKIVHTGRNVTVVHARLWPPILNTGMIVHGQNGAASVSMWSWWQYPRVRAAMIDAGFTLEDVTRWISRGEQLARGQTRRTRG